MNLKPLIILTFIVHFFTPSVFCQNKKPKHLQTITFDMGAHQLYVDGEKGANIGINFEKVTSRKFTFELSFKDYINPVNTDGYSPSFKKITEHRLMFKTGFKLYPQAALSGFYLNFNLGSMIHFNALNRLSVINNTTNPPSINTKNNFNFMTDFNIGYQFLQKSTFTWGIFIGTGIIQDSDNGHSIINAFKRLTWDNTFPFFQAGMKIGKSF